MKANTFFAGILLPLAALFTGCASESFPEEPKTTEPAAVTETAQVQGIRNYLNQTHKGTRAGNYQLIPYVEDGDTIMYVAQYEDGWELFSNSLNMPMFLMRNDTGSFSNVMSDANPALKHLFERIKEFLVTDKNAAVPQATEGAEEWLPYVSVSQSSSPNPTNPPGGNAVYTLVGEKEISSITQSVPHLICTHWHQNDPLNRFMEFQLYETDKHIAVGCTAVAVGQFLYYAHNKWGLQTSIPSKAIYNQAKNEYSFTDFSKDQYSKMHTDYYFWDGDEGPVFLAWIANSIGAEPRYDKNVYKGTGASFDEGVSFINNLTCYNAKSVDFNDYIAAHMLLEGKPVPLWLQNKNKNEPGHVVIVDAVDYTEAIVDYYYAYVEPGSGSGNTGSDPTKPSGPTTSPGSDYNSLVAQYGQIYTENRTVITAFFRFNWGWADKNKDDKVWINGKVIPTITIQTSKDKYEDRNYSPYKMMTYTIK